MERYSPPNYQRGNQAFTPGSLLVDSFKTTMANLAPFIIIALICKLPVIIWDYSFMDAPPPGTGTEAEDPMSLDALFSTDNMVRFIMDMFCNTLCQAAMVYGTVQFLSGRRVPMDECLSKGLSRLVPALGVAAVCIVIIGCGTLLFIVPGIVLTCILYLAVPVSVIENPGILGAMQRSRDLTVGHRLILFLTIFSLFFMAFFASMFIHILLGPASGIVAFTAQEVMGLFFATVGSVVSAVAYMRLREQKDGVQAEELVMVFE